jgi:hypothetical protein
MLLVPLKLPIAAPEGAGEEDNVTDTGLGFPNTLGLEESWWELFPFTFLLNKPPKLHFFPDESFCGSFVGVVGASLMF